MTKQELRFVFIILILMFAIFTMGCRMGIICETLHNYVLNTSYSIHDDGEPKDEISYWIIMYFRTSSSNVVLATPVANDKLMFGSSINDIFTIINYIMFCIIIYLIYKNLKINYTTIFIVFFAINIVLFVFILSFLLPYIVPIRASFCSPYCETEYAITKMGNFFHKIAIIFPYIITFLAGLIIIKKVCIFTKKVSSKRLK